MMMRDGRHLTVLALLLCCLALPAAARIYHTPGIHNLITGAGTNSTLVADESAITVVVATDPTMTSFVNLFAPITSGSWVSTPLALMSVCVGHSLTKPDVLTSTAKLGAALLGTPANEVFLSFDGLRFGTSDVVFVLPRATTAMSVIMKAFVRDGVPGFATHTEYPAAVQANPRVIWVATDNDVAAAVAAGPNRVGFAAMSQCIALHAAEVAVHVDGRQEKHMVTPVLKEGAAEHYEVDPDTHTVTPSSNIPTYPFVGVALVNIKKPIACDESARDFQGLIVHMAETSSNSVQYAHSNTISLTPAQSIETITHVLHSMAHCPRTSHTTMRGSSAIATVVHRWASDYLQIASVVVDYAPTGSGSGITAVKAHDVPVAGSDSVFTTQERLNFPTIRFAPAVTFAVSVVVNVPGVSAFNIPECTLVSILSGTVTHWDDASLVAANPQLTLPHQPITVVARTTRSGTTEVFTTGLANIDAHCNAVPTVQVTNTWALRADVGTSSSSQVLQHVKTTPWSIGYGSTDLARATYSTEAAILQRGIRVTTDAAFVEAGVNAASFDASTGYLQFARAEGAYPFVGASYYLYHSVYPGNCTAVRRAIDFVKWSIGDSSARAAALDSNYVPVIKPIAANAELSLNKVMCAGQYLYPQPDDSTGFPVWAIALIAIGAVLFVGAALFVALGPKPDGRDVKFAPKKTPVTLVITDIQDSTKLWSNCPASMSAALEDHHRIIRECISRHGGYEVKTVGDSFVIACQRSEDAVKIAIDIEESIQKQRFPRAIAEVYASEDTFVEVDDDPEDLAELDPVWNGVRVRIGVHTMEECDIRLDDVTKGYEYSGTEVTVAGKIEALGRGGQILCSFHVAESIPADKYILEDYTKADIKPGHGLQQLLQIVPPSLKGRVFVPQLDILGEHQSESSQSASGVSTAADLQDVVQSFPFVQSGYISAQLAEGMTIRLADTFEFLFAPAKPKDRDAALKMFSKSWKVKLGDTPETCLRLALKVLPVSINKQMHRKSNRKSTLYLSEKHLTPMSHGQESSERKSVVSVLSTN